MPDLSTGDFVYQSDQELFLVCIGEDENTYKFAVHGWRSIDKERLDEYVSHDNGKLYKQDDIIETIENEAAEDEKRHFDELQEMFAAYTEIDLKEDGPHTDFELEDT